MATLTHNAIQIDGRPAFFVVVFVCLFVCFFQLKGKNLHKFCKALDYPTLQVR